MEVTRIKQRAYIKNAVLQGGNLPCDFDLLPKIKEPIYGRRFATRKDIAKAVRQQVILITHCAENSEADGIQRLLHGWQREVTVVGDSTEGLLGPGPFLSGLPGANFQQDNVRTHTARVVQDFLRYFQTFLWLAHSPDMSPVEHVWYRLKRHMPSCHSLHDLELAVQDLWAHLPQDSIRCLINSMPDRVVACIAAGGGPTRY
ncbi:transposable element Tcb2 transposase [Trichonephila clavipes]|nr:transposable element Tcb2 transposase [Trichonephila clavipes]